MPLEHSYTITKIDKGHTKVFFNPPVTVHLVPLIIVDDKDGEDMAVIIAVDELDFRIICLDINRAEKEIMESLFLLAVASIEAPKGMNALKPGMADKFRKRVSMFVDEWGYLEDEWE